ncbi:MAG: efflux RND transporter periplasmic adaptor subunit [Spirochaetes bacterium]|nr:efflux RND transporter periplasmic adaptor subunit [Spirochaetota bacterium]
MKRKNALLWAIVLPLVGLFLFVALRTGPLASVAVTVAAVEVRSLTPAIFGVGTVEAQSVFKIGPNAPGRVRQVYVHVGDKVKPRQLLAEMERPDLDILNSSDAERDFIKKALQQEESDARARVRAAEVTLAEVDARHDKSERGLQRAREALRDAREDLARVSGNAKNPLRVSANLRLVSPVYGLVTQRSAEPGTTLVAGQAAVEVIDPKSLWVNVRLDQSQTPGLQPGLSAKIQLRSQTEPLAGRVLRIEPVADAVTEETLAKIVFATLPTVLPPLGEIAEVTLALPPSEAKPTILNASLVRIAGELGVWVVDHKTHKLRFAPVKTGTADLEGHVQILEGLAAHEKVVVYSRTPLVKSSRIKIVERLMGVDG